MLKTRSVDDETYVCARCGDLVALGQLDVKFDSSLDHISNYCCRCDGGPDSRRCQVLDADARSHTRCAGRKQTRNGGHRRLLAQGNYPGRSENPDIA